ncbi:glutamate decarboxylase [Priestia aryabhattai]|nr:glutamate decarboxylase [Priestia aryabhattai]
MPQWHEDREQKKLPNEFEINPLFSRQGEKTIPRLRMRDEGMLPDTAYQIIHDEISLDGNARLNLATFVTTWMEPDAERLYKESFDKNMVDKDEYPQTAAIEERCVRILADLWNAPDPESTMGVSTTGSSEACMLGGLALKRRWQQERKKKGLPTAKPNIVFSSAVQVVWEKFANYWDVEPRYVNISPDAPYLDPKGVVEAVDENTIAVVPILGVTYTGVYEPIAEIAKALDELEEKTGINIPIHVDAASGGFIAPFLQPDLVWDFRLPRVKSINVSGHKYGLVYPGLGWVIWREKSDLPEDLIFRVSYLGGNMPTFALNFSRPGSQVLLQYYNFLRLGKEGYYAVQKASQETAYFLSEEIGKLDSFEVLSNGSDIPVLAWKLKDGYTDNWTLYDLSRQLRTYGWQVPAYPLPKDMEGITIMRIVVRNGFSRDLAHLLLINLKQAVEFLNSLDRPIKKDSKYDNGFHH